MRLVWTTDLHLNHVSLPEWDRWCGEVKGIQADALLITGDISEADDVGFQLQRLVEAIDIPVHFVLGNHDFYGASIAATHRRIASLARHIDPLVYLTDSSAVRLSDGHYLVGEDGWGDATVGDYDNSPVRLCDFRDIKDFRRVDPIDWPGILKRQGADAADRLRKKLVSLPSGVSRLTIATHVPPFREACWYEGKTANDDWAPFFVCGQVGEVLLDFCEQRPSIESTVLCGHTHHAGETWIRPNLKIRSAAAEYGRLAVADIIEA